MGGQKPGIETQRTQEDTQQALSKQQRPIRKTLEGAIKCDGSDGRGIRPFEEVQIAAERRNEVSQEGLAFETRDVRVAKVLRIGRNRQKKRPGDGLSDSRKREKAYEGNDESDQEADRTPEIKHEVSLAGNGPPTRGPESEKQRDPA